MYSGRNHTILKGVGESRMETMRHPATHDDSASALATRFTSVSTWYTTSTSTAGTTALMMFWMSRCAGTCPTVEICPLSNTTAPPDECLTTASIEVPVGWTSACSHAVSFANISSHSRACAASELSYALRSCISTSDPSRDDTDWMTNSQAMRCWWHGTRGAEWWHATRPHNLWSTRIPITNEDRTPMFERYCMWHGCAAREMVRRRSVSSGRIESSSPTRLMSSKPAWCVS
mmetsp:Transcript_32581/g.77299  ORF Transcript_32581/g.77299 Transcript_32581/m.77299 type:complete len:232 (+) Transcript_32581:3013-3708(+)